MEKVEQNEGDFVFVLIVALLLGIGIAVLFSASYFHAERLDKDPWYFFRKQLLFIAAGIVIGFLASRTSLEAVKKAVPWLLLASFILSLMTFIPGISRTILGARRWILLFGFSFQPSEMVKFVVVVYLSHMLSKKQDQINNLKHSVLPPIIIIALFTALIYFQNDYSTAIFLFFIAVSMFFIANLSMRYFVFFSMIVVPLGLVLLFTKVYWVKKLMVFFNIDNDPTGSGYQIIQARASLISGGFLGRGLGNGLKKLGGLPEADSDFIFAVIGEEMGFIGILFVIFLFGLLAYRGYLITVRAENPFQYYLAFGITSLIVVQAFLNIGVVVGIIPATGMPLPFFSNGGSAMLFNLIMCGLLFNISRRRRIQRRESSV